MVWYFWWDAVSLKNRGLCGWTGGRRRTIKADIFFYLLFLYLPFFHSLYYYFFLLSSLFVFFFPLLHFALKFLAYVSWAFCIQVISEMDWFMGGGEWAFSFSQEDTCWLHVNMVVYCFTWGNFGVITWHLLIIAVSRFFIHPSFYFPPIFFGIHTFFDHPFLGNSLCYMFEDGGALLGRHGLLHVQPAVPRSVPPGMQSRNKWPNQIIYQWQ